MGQIVATMKIFPSDIIIDLNKLKESIKQALPKDSSVYRFDEEPIAFGLVAIIAHIILPESNSGDMDKVEESLKKIEGVGEVEVVLVRRF
jgi:elongation factor 1-beta